MKILLCNIALRNKPDPFPPVACTTLFNLLKKIGYEPYFYDIDSLRPSAEEMREFFRKGQFDVVGISAVVSTGYKYTKDLTGIIREVSPKTQIIVGGNLAAAYEVLLRRCRVDLCVIGEGEKVLPCIVECLKKYGDVKSAALELAKIKGVAFLNPDGTSNFTGHAESVRSDEIEEPDYDILSVFSNIEHYISDPMTRDDFTCDPRSRQPVRQGKKMATIFTSKGCINRCTFCHRWIKGYRVIPLEKVVSAIRHLADKYNVGFFLISDECFGEDREWLERFIAAVKPMDILFQVGGARVSLVKKDPTLIARLKEAGLTTIYFGIESGSDKILSVMGKNATRSENLAALRICGQAGVYTVIQLVIGMPGENDHTVNETIEFIKNATEELPSRPLVAVNYLQTLPATPCYDFLRRKGLLSKEVEDEERYLLKVSDMNASDFRQYVNVSEEPLPKVKLWRTKIYYLPLIHWLKLHGWRFDAGQKAISSNTAAVRPNISSRFKAFLKNNILLCRAIDIMGDGFWNIILLANRFSLYGARKTILIISGLAKEPERSAFIVNAENLKEIINGGACNGN